MAPISAVQGGYEPRHRGVVLSRLPLHSVPYVLLSLPAGSCGAVFARGCKLLQVCCCIRDVHVCLEAVQVSLIHPSPHSRSLSQGLMYCDQWEDPGGISTRFD